MKEIFAFLQTNRVVIDILFGSVIILTILYVSKYLQRAIRVAMMTAMADNILRELCDPRISYVHRHFDQDIHILKSDLHKNSELLGPMMLGIYRFSFAIQSTNQHSEKRVVVVLRKKKHNGKMVEIYSSIDTIRL